MRSTLLRPSRRNILSAVSALVPFAAFAQTVEPAELPLHLCNRGVLNIAPGDQVQFVRQGGEVTPMIQVPRNAKGDFITEVHFDATATYLVVFTNGESTGGMFLPNGVGHAGRNRVMLEIG